MAYPRPAITLQVQVLLTNALITYGPGKPGWLYADSAALAAITKQVQLDEKAVRAGAEAKNWRDTHA